MLPVILNTEGQTHRATDHTTMARDCHGIPFSGHSRTCRKRNRTIA